VYSIQLNNNFFIFGLDISVCWEQVTCKVATPIIDLVECIVIFCLPLVTASSLAKQTQLISVRMPALLISLHDTSLVIITKGVKSGVKEIDFDDR
jgi:hypothetical protein